MKDKFPEVKVIVATIIGAAAAGIVTAVGEANETTIEIIINGAVAGLAVLVAGWITPNLNPGPSSTKAVLARRARDLNEVSS